MNLSLPANSTSVRLRWHSDEAEHWRRTASPTWTAGSRRTSIAASNGWTAKKFLGQWAAHWQDLEDFDFIPVRSS
jgi:hypothetical protein